MTRLIDLTGRRFGRLTVLGQAPHTPPQRPQWHCRCDCGQTTIVAARHLTGKGTKSCGCLQHPSTHGQRHSAEYRIWLAVKNRCLNVNAPVYQTYGGRGITVCEAWRTSFEQFYADMGPRPSPQHTIERLDNDGPYAPGNCVWATRKEQARNKRGTRHILMDGHEVSLQDAAEAMGLKRGIVSNRLHLGWPLIDALYAPVGTRRPRQRTTDG